MKIFSLGVGYLYTMLTPTQVMENSERERHLFSILNMTHKRRTSTMNHTTSAKSFVDSQLSKSVQ